MPCPPFRSLSPFTKEDEMFRAREIACSLERIRVVHRQGRSVVQLMMLLRPCNILTTKYCQMVPNLAKPTWHFSSPQDVCIGREVGWL